MYGTVAHIRPKVGQEQAVITVMNDWQRERKPKAKGAIAGYLYQTENGSRDLIMVAVFQDKASYRANAEDPDQDRWYHKMRDLLEADPTWEDGEIISTV